MALFKPTPVKPAQCVLPLMYNLYSCWQIFLLCKLSLLCVVHACIAEDALRLVLHTADSGFYPALGPFTFSLYVCNSDHHTCLRKAH